MHKQESKFCENCIFFKQTKKSLKNYSLRGANDTKEFFLCMREYLCENRNHISIEFVSRWVRILKKICIKNIVTLFLYP